MYNQIHPTDAYCSAYLCWLRTNVRSRDESCLVPPTPGSCWTSFQLFPQCTFPNAHTFSVAVIIWSGNFSMPRPTPSCQLAADARRPAVSLGFYSALTKMMLLTSFVYSQCLYLRLLCQQLLCAPVCAPTERAFAQQLRMCSSDPLNIAKRVGWCFALSPDMEVSRFWQTIINSLY